jgi:hypothetical protein
MNTAKLSKMYLARIEHELVKIGFERQRSGLLRVPLGDGDEGILICRMIRHRGLDMVSLNPSLGLRPARVAHLIEACRAEAKTIPTMIAPLSIALPAPRGLHFPVTSSAEIVVQSRGFGQAVHDHVLPWMRTSITLDGLWNLLESRPPFPVARVARPVVAYLREDRAAMEAALVELETLDSNPQLHFKEYAACVRDLIESEATRG